MTFANQTRVLFIVGCISLIGGIIAASVGGEVHPSHGFFDTALYILLGSALSLGIPNVCFPDT